MTALLDAYSGKRATGYDRRRARTRRWRAEVSAFEAMLSASNATCVLDCPFGTGRWVPQYAHQKMNVLGVDLSAGMLAEAKTKIAALPLVNQDQIALIEHSIFDLSPTRFSVQPDLIVCVRFLNWIGPNDVERVLDVFSAFQANEMIVGASVVPKNSGRLARYVYRTSLERINAKHPDRPTQYVHDEGWLLSALNNHGWTVVDQTKIMRRSSRVNYLYRCVRN